MSIFSSFARGTVQPPLGPRTSGRRIGLLLATALLGAVILPRPAAAANNYYWYGAHDNNWNTTGGAAGTNFSTSSAFDAVDPSTLPTSSDNVYFVLAGAGNLNTVLGQSFSINSLNFTTDAVSADNITIGNGGVTGNTLTIGAGGLTDNGAATITLSANVIVGTAETWANDSTTALTVSGSLEGTSNLTLEGSGATTGTATGAFLFTGNNSYSGQITLLNDQTSLILGGNGSLSTLTSSPAGITLNGGSSLILDNSSDNNNPGAVNSSTRLASTVGITSLGGNFTLLGSSSGSTSQTVGTLTIGSGATYVTVTPGTGRTATLTFGATGTVPSFNRVTGGTVVFSNTGTIKAPNVTLEDATNPIIGGWAAIGATPIVLNEQLDWATVNGSGNVVPLATYQTLVGGAGCDGQQPIARRRWHRNAHRRKSHDQFPKLGRLAPLQHDREYSDHHLRRHHLLRRDWNGRHADRFLPTSAERGCSRPARIHQPTQSSIHRQHHVQH